MAGLALPASRTRRVQARSHHDPPKSRRIYGVFGHEMPHVRLSALMFGTLIPVLMHSTVGLSRAWSREARR